MLYLTHWSLVMIRHFNNNRVQSIVINHMYLTKMTKKNLKQPIENWFIILKKHHSNFTLNTQISLKERLNVMFVAIRYY